MEYQQYIHIPITIEGPSQRRPEAYHVTQTAYQKSVVATHERRLWDVLKISWPWYLGLLFLG